MENANKKIKKSMPPNHITRGSNAKYVYEIGR